MERRKFVLLAATGALAVSIPAVHYFFYAVPAYDKKLSNPQSLSLIWDEETMMGIGAKYKEQVADESTERALVRALFEDAVNQSNEKLMEMTQADFYEGKLVTIDGWVLSKTEARQCALYHSLNYKSA